MNLYKMSRVYIYIYIYITNNICFCKVNKMYKYFICIKMYNYITKVSKQIYFIIVSEINV